MQQQDFKDKWPQLKERLQKEYPHLTNEDLIYQIGKEGELLKRLEKKLGKTDKEIRYWLSLMG